MISRIAELLAFLATLMIRAMPREDHKYPQVMDSLDVSNIRMMADLTLVWIPVSTLAWILAGTLEWILEWTLEWIPEWILEWTPEWTPEWTLEWTLEWTPE